MNLNLNLKLRNFFRAFFPCADFHHIVASLNNGVTFYGDLIRRLARLNQNVLDAAYTMNLSRREIELSHAAQRAAKDNLESDREMAHQMSHEYIETAKPLPKIPTGQQYQQLQ